MKERIGVSDLFKGTEVVVVGGVKKEEKKRYVYSGGINNYLQIFQTMILVILE